MATMAATGTLHVPQPDDTMDMSSPGRHFHDHEDIDIDFEDYQQTKGFDDDDMLDDGEPNTMLVSTDAEMDEGVVQNTVLEAEMSDHIDGEIENEFVHDITADEDELIDYDEEEWSVSEEPAAQLSSAPDIPIAVEERFVDVPPVSHLEMSQSASQNAEEAQIPSQAEPTTASDDESHSALDHKPVSQEQNMSANPADASAPAESNAQAYPGSVPAVEQSASQETGVDDEGSAHLKEVEDERVQTNHESNHELHQASSVRTANLLENKDIAASQSPPDQGTPTDTGLHPVTLQYNATEYALFKSRSEPTGLLSDDNLCNVSLAELMEHCKDELQRVSPQESTQDMEAVMSFDSLPLTSLTETARAAYETSLHDILEVYLELHQNDGLPEIPALALTLSLQYKFTHTLDLFRHMAKSGKGYSSVPGVFLAEPQLGEGEFDLAEGHEETEEDAERLFHQEAIHNDKVVAEDVYEDKFPQEEDVATLTHAADDEDENGLAQGQDSTRSSITLDNETINITMEPHHDDAGTSAALGKESGSIDGDGHDSPQVDAETHDDEHVDKGEETVLPESFEYPQDNLREDFDEYDIEAPRDATTSEHIAVHVDGAELTSYDDVHNEENDENEPIEDAEFAEDDYYDETVHGDDEEFDEEHDDIPFEQEAETDILHDFHHDEEASLDVQDNETAETDHIADDEQHDSAFDLVDHDDDTIDFDDDTTEQHLARVKTQDGGLPAVHSPSTKRSFAEHSRNDDDFDFDDAPDAKKTRAR